MGMISDIVVLRPLWVLALPVLVALAVFGLRRAGRPGDWQTRIQPELLAELAALGRVEKARSGLDTAVPIAIAGLVAMALTGPAVEQRGAQTFRNLDGVIFVVDVSGSMTRDTTWDGVVTMARAGLSVLGSKPAALIVYAGDSYLASPLTTDHLQLGQTLSLLNEATVPDPGNRPALALTRAAEVLEQAGILYGDVVLMSDGAGLGPGAQAAAARIARLGAGLWIVAAETTVPGEAAVPRSEALGALASAGQGRLYGLDQVTDFMADLKAADRQRLERQDLKLLLFADMGRYLLLAALLPTLLLFRRERP